MDKISVVSLFSGCGGGDLGLLGGFSYLGKDFRKLPFEIKFALDNDEKAVRTYNLNFPQPAFVMDVKEATEEKLPGAVDMVIGGFPCQSFSTVNPTKDPFDERGQLYKEMARILRSLKPKVFIAENVKGMLVLRKGKIFERILEEFSSAGYTPYHKLINAADYGVPQRRQRVFIVGVRNDLNKEFSFPAPTHSDTPTGKLAHWVGIKNILEGLELPDKKYYFSEKAVQGMRNAKNNMKRGLWQDVEKPSLTVTSHLAKVSINSRDPVLLVNRENSVYRRFTPREAARLQSFPESFRFAGSESDAYRQIGQAIAPVVMWHLGNEICGSLFKND